MIVTFALQVHAVWGARTVKVLRQRRLLCVDVPFKTGSTVYVL
jgi:hypothetical protein